MKAASLSSSLLARKGTAAPADLSVIPAAHRHTVRVEGAKPSSSTDRPDPPKATGKRSTGERAADGRPPRCAQVTTAATAKFTLRLDRKRHLKLKLLAAHLHLSAQELLVDALDAYLDQRIPEAIRNNCGCLAQLEENPE